MKKRKIIAVLLAISVVGSSFLFSSVEKVDPVLENATAIAKKLFYADEVKKDEEKEEKKRETIVSSYLQGLDGEHDYIISESIAGGYAIFEKESMELIEYSAVGSSPYNAIAGDYRGYAGPNGYFEKKGEQFVDIHTKKKLSKDKGVQVATNIQNKITTDRVARKEKLEKEKKEFSKYGQTGLDLSSGAGPTGDSLWDANSYTILEQVHIPDYQFFVGNNGHGHNANNTCSSVASQLLLAYNNWAKDGRLLGESNLLENETIFLSNWDAKEQEPYSQARIGTTSETLTNSTISFYEALLSYINVDTEENEEANSLNSTESIYSRSTTGHTYNGIKEYLEDRLTGYTIYSGNALLLWNDIFNGIEDTLQDKEIYMSFSNLIIPQSYVYEKIIDEINKGRPVHTGITTYETKNDTRSGEYAIDFHDVVVYGYQTILYAGQELNGFIAHFGWKKEGNLWDQDTTKDKDKKYTHIWFNSSWAYRYITFAVGHEHADFSLSSNSHIVKCDECNRTTTTSQHIHSKNQKIVNYGVVDSHYHDSVCSCGYVIQKVLHPYTYTPEYNQTHSNTNHTAKCSLCGHTESRPHWSEGESFYTRYTTTQHKKHCICSNNGDIYVLEEHLFKNGAKCILCDEPNPNRSEKK